MNQLKIVIDINKEMIQKKLDLVLNKDRRILSIIYQKNIIRSYLK